MAQDAPGTGTRPYRDAGRWLARQRRRRKLSQEALAGLLQVHQATISKYEVGLSRPSDEVAAAIAQVFRLSERTVRRELGLYVPEARPKADGAWPDGTLRLPAGVILTEKQQKALDALLDAFVEDLERVGQA